MKISSIKVGGWYETKSGTGQVVAAGGTFPPSVRIRIVAPFPRGEVMVSPRDVLRKLDADEAPPGRHGFVSDLSQPHRHGRCTQCGLAEAEGNHQ